MSFANMIQSASVSELSDWLDGLTPEARLHECRSLGRAAQRQLFDKAGESPGLTIEDFVPSGVDALAEVVHEGKNTLPVFTLFQKRFCRPQDRDDILFGYNEGTTRALIGPGYFVLRSTAGDPTEEALGAIVVDYTMIPDGPVTPGWPEVIPNSQKLQRFVYYNTQDFMRRVSSHVSIGAAYKKGKSMGAFFLLCRQD